MLLNSEGKSAVEMTGRRKAWKTRTGFPTLPSTLGNLANPARFPHSHSHGYGIPHPQLENKTRKEIGRCAAPSAPRFHDHPALESITGFMIIRGLENAFSTGADVGVSHG
jgi:hypothetical protein